MDWLTAKRRLCAADAGAQRKGRRADGAAVGDLACAGLELGVALFGPAWSAVEMELRGGRALRMGAALEELTYCYAGADGALRVFCASGAVRVLRVAEPEAAAFEAAARAAQGSGVAAKDEALAGLREALEEELAELAAARAEQATLAQRAGSQAQLNPLASRAKRCEGYLCERVAPAAPGAPESVRQRYWCLAGQRLWSFDGAQHDGAPQGCVPVRRCAVAAAPAPAPAHCLVLETPRRRLVLQARHGESLAAWLDALGGAAPPAHEPQAMRSSVHVLQDHEARARLRAFLRGRAQESLLEFTLRAVKHAKLCRDHAQAQDAGDAAAGSARLLQESCLEILGDFFDPDSAKFVPALSGEREACDERIQAQDYAGCLHRGLQLASEALEQLTPEYLRSEPHKALVQARAGRPELSAATLFGDLSLRVSRRKHALRQLKLPVGTTRVGRDCTCELVLEDPTASRVHCVFVVDDVDRCIVRDAGSTKGIKLNGRAVNSAGLRAGDVVEVASYKLELCVGLDDPKQP
jgi:pSer/pThr/pTyr-binding forkhead associated (FHA) protein